MKDPTQYNYRLIHMIKTENEGEDDSEEDDGFWDPLDYLLLSS